jgi:hypothetical protein
MALASGIFTVGTGQEALRTTRSATLPIISRLNPVRPCVPITMRSHPASRVTPRISTAGSPQADTLFLGDGINDAPALTAATVGIAFGQNSDITAEAAGAVVMETSLQRVDELLHASQRLRTIALQSAVGGMALSLIGMFFAAAGYLPPVAGAVLQEAIDVLAVVNALRVAMPPGILSDYPPRVAKRVMNQCNVQASSRRAGHDQGF